MAEQISALKSKEKTIEKEDISLKQLIEYTLIETAEWIKEKDINVRLDHIEDCTIYGDFDLLISCLANLLDHALDYSEDKETITISTIDSMDYPVCELTFTGKKYSEKQLNELAVHYTETGKQMNLKLGIDLALAQLIMESHDGYVDFKRDNEGKVSLGLVFGNKTTGKQEPG